MRTKGVPAELLSAIDAALEEEERLRGVDDPSAPTLRAKILRETRAALHAWIEEQVTEEDAAERVRGLVSRH